MRQHILAAAFFALAGAGSAFSADLYQPPVAEAPEAAPVSAASGWYLRGDVGYVFNEMRGADYILYAPAGSRGSFDKTELDDSFSLGGGVGYQITNHFRADLTGDYLFDSDFHGSTRGGGAAFGACVGPCTSTDLSSMSAFSLLANAYVDIGTWGRVTPYVGAGIGGTHVKWDNLNNTSCADDGSGCDATVTHKGKANWRFTYALMAGASVDLTCNLKLDAGYRYRHVEGGEMFDYAEGGGPGYDKGFDLHEGRAGLRYVFGGCEQQQVYLPPVEMPSNPVYK